MVTSDYSGAPTGWTLFRTSLQDAWKSVRDTRRHSSWDSIRKTVSSFVRNAFPAIGTTLFRGPLNPPTVIGSLRTDLVTGGYATLEPTLSVNIPVASTPVEALEVLPVEADPAPVAEPEPPPQRDTPSVLEVLKAKKQKGPKTPVDPPGLEKDNPGPPVKPPDFHQGSFKINGVEVAVSASDTVQDVVAKIDNAGAGVTGVYDAATQKMTLLSTAVTETPIALSDDTSGFLDAVGLDDTAVSSVPLTSSPYDVALAHVPEYAGVVAGTVTVNDQTVAIDPTVMTVRDVVSAIDALDGVTAVLNESSGTVSISTQGKTMTLADTSGVLSALGIATGTHKESPSIVAAAPVVDPQPPGPPKTDEAAAPPDDQPAVPPPVTHDTPRLRPARVFTRRAGHWQESPTADDTRNAPSTPRPFEGWAHSPWAEGMASSMRQSSFRRLGAAFFGRGRIGL